MASFSETLVTLCLIYLRSYGSSKVAPLSLPAFKKKNIKNLGNGFLHVGICCIASV